MSSKKYFVAMVPQICLVCILFLGDLPLGAALPYLKVADINHNSSRVGVDSDSDGQESVGRTDGRTDRIPIRTDGAGDRTDGAFVEVEPHAMNRTDNAFVELEPHAMNRTDNAFVELEVRALPTHPTEHTFTVSIPPKKVNGFVEDWDWEDPHEDPNPASLGKFLFNYGEVKTYEKLREKIIETLRRPPGPGQRLRLYDWATDPVVRFPLTGEFVFPLQNLPLGVEIEDDDGEDRYRQIEDKDFTVTFDSLAGTPPLPLKLSHVEVNTGRALYGRIRQYIGIDENQFSRLLLINKRKIVSAESELVFPDGAVLYLLIVIATHVPPEFDAMVNRLEAFSASEHPPEQAELLRLADIVCTALRKFIEMQQKHSQASGPRWDGAQLDRIVDLFTPLEMAIGGVFADDPQWGGGAVPDSFREGVVAVLLKRLSGVPFAEMLENTRKCVKHGAWGSGFWVDYHRRSQGGRLVPESEKFQFEDDALDWAASFLNSECIWDLPPVE